MGMDVYVGPLSRYLLQDWMTVAQQVGQANGYDVQVLRPNEPASSDPAHVESIVSTW
jgi:hypothetical protein